MNKSSSNLNRYLQYIFFIGIGFLIVYGSTIETGITMPQWSEILASTWFRVVVILIIIATIVMVVYKSGKKKSVSISKPIPSWIYSAIAVVVGILLWIYVIHPWQRRTDDEDLIAKTEREIRLQQQYIQPNTTGTTTKVAYSGPSLQYGATYNLNPDTKFIVSLRNEVPAFVPTVSDTFTIRFFNCDDDTKHFDLITRRTTDGTFMTEIQDDTANHADGKYVAELHNSDATTVLYTASIPSGTRIGQ